MFHMGLRLSGWGIFISRAEQQCGTLQNLEYFIYTALSRAIDLLPTQLRRCKQSAFQGTLRG